MNGTPVISIKRKTDKLYGTQWYVIVRGAIYRKARLTTSASQLGQVLAIAEEHLRLWGYNEIEVTRAIANAFRNLRRRYGAGVLNEAVTETQREAVDQLEPYPD